MGHPYRFGSLIVQRPLTFLAVVDCAQPLRVEQFRAATLPCSNDPVGMLWNRLHFRPSVRLSVSVFQVRASVGVLCSGSDMDVAVVVSLSARFFLSSSFFFFFFFPFFCVVVVDVVSSIFSYYNISYDDIGVYSNTVQRVD